MTVDVPEDSKLRVPKFYLEVSGKKVERLSPAMKKELKFKVLEEPPQAINRLGRLGIIDPLRKLYASEYWHLAPHRFSLTCLSELPRGAIVLYRKQKDRGGFADGKDHIVKGECILRAGCHNGLSSHQSGSTAR